MKKDEIIKFIEEVFQQKFPCAYVDGYLQSNGNTISGNLNNGFSYGTRFYAQASKRKYLHFTKTESAIKILESSSLWLSNLNTFNDKLEFILAAEKLFNLSKDETLEYKNKLFAASFTELNINQNVFAEFPYHWQKYAEVEKGVALEFEFKQYKNDGYECFEDPALKPFYYLVRVQYYDDITQDTIISSLKLKINSLITEKNLIEFLFPLISAYKREKEEPENFIEEKEIRLLYSDGNNPIDCKPYRISHNAETFYGLTYNEFKPFHQLPFTYGNLNSSKTSLNLNGIYLGRHIDKEHKLHITDISNRLGIKLHVN